MIFIQSNVKLEKARFQILLCVIPAISFILTAFCQYHTVVSDFFQSFGFQKHKKQENIFRIGKIFSYLG